MKAIFKIYVLFSILLIGACSENILESKIYNNGINIIPRPQNLSQKEGFFELNKGTSFVVKSDEERKIALFFAEKLKQSTGFEFTISEKPVNNSILLSIDDKSKLGTEAYTLSITKDGVVANAKTAQGLFYAMASMIQLLPAEIESSDKLSGMKWMMPCVYIQDSPRFEYRGYMLDVSRHFTPIEYIKKHLDILALVKINKFHFHLTDNQGWRIEIKKYPALTEYGSKRIDAYGKEYSGFYTQEEVKDLVKYAAERFITIIPEIDVPAHAMVVCSACPEISCTGEQFPVRNIWGPDHLVMCPGKENMFVFLDDIFKELVEVFPSEYYHIGGDECPKNNWKVCPDCQSRIKKEKLLANKEYTKEERLQSYAIGRVGEILEKYNKKMIGWDEILEGGLPESATVMSWTGEKGGIEAALMKHDIIMTPNNAGLYFNYFQGDSKIEPVCFGQRAYLEKVYSYDPIPQELVEKGQGHFVKGVQANVWSEYIYDMDQLEYQLFPNFFALAEISWTELKNKDFKDFSRRVNNAYVRLDHRNVNYHIPLPEQPFGSSNHVAFIDSVDVSFKTTRPIDIVYTIDGTEPTPASQKYSKALKFTSPGTIKIASLLPSGKMSKVRNIKIEQQKLSPAVKVKNPTQGLSMIIADGTFYKSSDLKDISNWRNVKIKNLKEITNTDNNPKWKRDIDNYSAIASGYVKIPADGVYFLSSNHTEVWIDDKLVVDNNGDVKRHSRNDSSMALKKGWHKLKIVFIGNLVGGWPSHWDEGTIAYRKSDSPKFAHVSPAMLSH